MSNMKQQKSLLIWGKMFPKPTQIKRNVTLAATGENHFIFTTANGDTFGMGSNRFGQLAAKQLIFYKQATPILDKFKIISLHCGAQFTFFITDQYEVYSMGMNIKGQLGHSMFQNQNTPKLVTALLPFGSKNPKASTLAHKTSKPPILDILQKFDLQVKLQESDSSPVILTHEEHIIDISCGALFTIALSNKGRIFGCGFQGVNSVDNHEDQLEKGKFKLISFDMRVMKIHSGISGSVLVTKEGFAYCWGRFGKINYNVPRKIVRQPTNPISVSKAEEQKYQDAKVGDQFILLLSTTGQLSTFGRNIDNQLGIQSFQTPFVQSPMKIASSPFCQSIFIGRNHFYAIDAETNELFGCGSNKHGQLFSGGSLQKCIVGIKGTGMIVDEGDMIIPGSYWTLALCATKRAPAYDFRRMWEQQSSKNKQEDKEEMIALGQYKKLLSDYQILKTLNLTLLQSHQPRQTASKESQTTSKFQITGVTQYRKFNSNIQISWKELQLETQINEGGYGLIYRAKWRQILVVVKKFKIENGDVSLRDFLSECHAMQAVRHPHIVMFLGAVTTPPHYSILLQYCSKGSLWSYLQNKQNNISWQDKRRFAIEIAQGVHYLHSCSPPILHRDLKSLNIFLDGALRIKIGDFGWTKTLDEYMTNKIGTYQWMAPQVIGNKPYTEKADVFSYSIIMWEIASREPPYKNITGAKVSEEVLNREMRPPIPKAPQGWIKLMKKCWQSDPAKRPSFKEIVKQLQIMKLQ